MAKRPVFVAFDKDIPYFDIYNIDFVWNPGMSISQKQKNIKALHDAFKERCPGRDVLEISSKSMQDGGIELSAFNLCKFVPELGRAVPVECVYQSGKVFEGGGPFTDLLTGTSKAAKQDNRLRTSGRLMNFSFDGVYFPKKPRFLFYTYLYVNALLENENLAEKVLRYDAFTDIEFSPNASANCQAMAAAIFVSLYKLGKLDLLKNPKDFANLFKKSNISDIETINEYEAFVADDNKSELQPNPVEIKFEVGSVIRHKKWGIGEVLSIEGDNVTVLFIREGEKKLDLRWCKNFCEFIC